MSRGTGLRQPGEPAANEPLDAKENQVFDAAQSPSASPADSPAGSPSDSPLDSPLDSPSGLPPDGVSVALVTPMTSDDTIDGPGVDRLVASVLAGGATGLSPGGSTGEGARLSRAQRRELISRVAGAAEGRPVIAGVPPSAPEDLRAELADVAAAGAQAALLTPPWPYRLSDAELVEHTERIADTSPLPVVLYHIPALAGIGYPPAVVERLAAHPRIVGVKDSSRELEYLHAIARRTAGAEFRIVTGTDTLLPESLAAGAVGAIVASPNVAPRWTPELFQAARAGDLERVAKIRGDLVDLVTAARAESFPAGWKAAAQLAGVGIEPWPVRPGHAVGADGRARLAQALRQLGLHTG